MPSNFTSKRNPAYVNLVDNNATSIGTQDNPIYTQEVGSGPNGEENVIVKDMPYEELTTSTLLSATTTLGSHSTANSIGYLVQADPDNTDNVLIVNNAITVLKMLPGQVNTIMLPGFDYASVSGTQAINVTAIGRVIPS